MSPARSLRCSRALCHAVHGARLELASAVRDTEGVKLPHARGCDFELVEEALAVELASDVAHRDVGNGLVE